MRKVELRGLEPLTS